MTHGRLNPDLNLEGLTPDEAFRILGNDIRLEIIRVLWKVGAAHEYDDGADTVETIAYSALRNQVDVCDNGKFNYHLSQLSPHFIRQSGNGYRLSGAGKQIARTVVAVTGSESIDFSADLETDCPLCDATVEVTYEDNWLRVKCTECNGLFGDQAPMGTLFLTAFPPAGLQDRTPNQALAAGLYRCALDITYMMYGICRECAGHVSTTMSVCENHDNRNNQHCADCGTRFPVWVDARCEICGFGKRLPVEMFVTGLAMATTVSDGQDFDLTSITFDEAIDILEDTIETSVSEDPRRVTVKTDARLASVSITLNETMDIIEFDREPRD